MIGLSHVRFDYTRSAGNAAGRTGDGLFHDFSLSIAPGSCVAVMGASGSGKSTLGRLLCGLLQPDSGRVLRHPDLRRRYDVVYVDQDPLNSVFPWQRVRQAIGYPLRKIGWDQGRIAERTQQLLRFFQLQKEENAYPTNLSGGQLQRLAVARCLSWQPRVAILDEAFSALDRRMKERILSDLPSLLQRDRTTVVLLTHHFTDVFLLAGRCVVLAGRPVSITADIPISVPFPRSTDPQEFRGATQTILEALKDGIA